MLHSHDNLVSHFARRHDLAEFVREKVLRVFTFGSPPVTTTTYKHVKNPTLKNTDYLDLIERGGAYQCDVLKEFNLPPFLVYGFAQPWVRTLVDSYDIELTHSDIHYYSQHVGSNCPALLSV
jgi:hypothetical protein